MEAHIGNKIRTRLAQSPNLTVKAFAERLGVHEQTVYDIYKRTDINTELLRKISDALEVPMSYFFEPDDSKEKDSSGKDYSERDRDRDRQIYQPPPSPTNGHYPRENRDHNREREKEERERDNAFLASDNGMKQTSLTESERLKQELAWEKEKTAYLERMLKDKEYIIRLLEMRLHERGV